MDRNEGWFVTRDDKKALHLEYGAIELRPLEAGEVLIRVEYASINYRDMLGTKGNVAIARSFPYYPGVDASGTVVLSTSRMFKKDETVFVAAIPNKSVYPGCWFKYIIAGETVVNKVPGRLTTREVTTFGTAGLCAALGVQAIAKFRDSTLTNEKMLVTGASGGVGSVAVALLSSMGCAVDAASRKTQQSDFLLDLGANRVLHPSELTEGSAPNLLKEEYAGVIDTLGGEVLSAALKRLSKGGAIACAGLVESQQLSLTVLPFLMRGVGLFGTGAEVASEVACAQAWSLLEAQVTKYQLARIAHVIAVDGLPDALEQITNGTHFGRFVLHFV